MRPTLCVAHTAVAYSTVFGGYSLFPWLLINSVILAHPTGQSPRGPIYPNETQKHFTPKKIQLTVKGPTLALGNHAKGSKKVSDLLEKLFSLVGRNKLYKLRPILNLSPSLPIQEISPRLSHPTFTMFFGWLWINGSGKYTWRNTERDKWLDTCIYEYERDFQRVTLSALFRKEIVLNFIGV